MKTKFKNKQKSHSLAEANEYAREQGYKYEERGLDSINVGDSIECGLNTWYAVEKKTSRNEIEITYKIVGKSRRADDEYFSNVCETPEEKRNKNRQYYLEWLESNKQLQAKIEK